MFDHLDDPIPFEPDARLHDAVVRRGLHLRRRRRTAVGGVATVGVAALGAVALAGRVERRLDDLQHVEVTSLPADEVSSLTEPTTLLLVGSDTDVGLGAGEAAIDRGRADSVLLVRIDPGRGVASLLPVPRDLWVDAPGVGPVRVAQAFEVGGPDLLIDAIGQDLGIVVDRYVEVDFAGAVAIGDALGGLRLSFDHPVRDRQTGLELDAGCRTVGGTELLALGRARQLEERIDGTWRKDPTSDLGRIERQQAIAAAVVDELTELDVARPDQLVELVDQVVEHVVLDARTTLTDLVAIVRALRDVDIASLRLPVTDAVIGGAAVLELGDATSVLQAFREGSPEVPPFEATPPEVQGSPRSVVPAAC